MLADSKVVLRHVEPRDLDDYIRASNDTRARGEHVFTAMRSPQKIRKRFEEDGLSSEASETFLITTQADVVVGQIGHFGTDHRFPEREIGYQIFSQEDRGKGYASSAVSLLVDYLFSSFAYNRLRGIVNPSNHASVRVITRAGFQKEGTLRGLMLVAGRYVDQDIYGFLREDWL